MFPPPSLRPRLLRLNDDGDYDVDDGDDCGNSVASTTIAATWWLRPRLRQLRGYDHGNGYDHDCCGSTTAAITTLAMVTIAEPMDVLEPPPAAWRGSSG